MAVGGGSSVGGAACAEGVKTAVSTPSSTSFSTTVAVSGTLCSDKTGRGKVAVGGVVGDGRETAVSPPHAVNIKRKTTIGIRFIEFIVLIISTVVLLQSVRAITVTKFLFLQSL